MSATPLRAIEAPVRGGCRVLSADGPEQAGAEHNQRLLAVMNEVTDLGSGSPELSAAARPGEWADTWALAAGRANIIRGLDLPPEAAVLEIGAGQGPVTRYLGEQCRLVDALEADAGSAAVARARTRDLDSVEVFVGTLDDVPNVPAYDVVVVVDLLEHVGGGSPDPAPYVAFLRGCRAVLRTGGTLVLAVGNPLGVKYLSGAVDEHTGRPFDPLEGYDLGTTARSFPRRILEDMLAAAGFATEVLAAFPDHRLPRVIMSDALFRSSGQLVEALPRFPSTDHQHARLLLADEAMVWHTLVSTGVAEHFSNSFLILASPDRAPSLWATGRLAVMFNSERQPEFAVRGEVRASDGAMSISRSPLYPARGETGEGTLRHTLAAEEPIVAGRELVQVLVDEPGRRGELLRRWIELVPDDEWAPVDLVPHNLVLTDDDVLVAIDQEWEMRGYDRTALLVRGLFQSALQMASRTRAARLAPDQTVAELMRVLAAEAGLAIDEGVLDRFTLDESDFQSRVNVTVGDRSERRARSADDLRTVLDMTIAAVRGGDRFDVQWKAAMLQIDELSAAREEEAVAHERTVAEFERALAASRDEAAALRARMPAAVARRVGRAIVRRLRVRAR